MINIEYENPLLKELSEVLFQAQHPNWFDLYFFVKLEYNYYRKRGYNRKDISVKLEYVKTLDYATYNSIKVTATISTPHTNKSETKIIGAIYHEEWDKQRNEVMEKAHDIIVKLGNIKTVISRLTN